MSKSNHSEAQMIGALCSFRPAALYSADSQTWSGGGEDAQTFGVDSFELRSMRGGHGTTNSAHCGNRNSSPRADRYRIHRGLGGERPGHKYPGCGNSRPRTPGRLAPWWPARMAPSMRPSLRSKKLIPELNPAEISGTVIIVPLVNIASFEQKVPHVNPVDGKSMNRFYPGNPNGTQTERASWAMTKQVVEKFDYLMTCTAVISMKAFGRIPTVRPKEYRKTLWKRVRREKNVRRCR